MQNKKVIILVYYDGDSRDLDLGKVLVWDDLDVLWSDFREKVLDYFGSKDYGWLANVSSWYWFLLEFDSSGRICEEDIHYAEDGFKFWDYWKI